MPKEEDELLFAELYPSLRKFAAVVADDDIEPEDIVSEVLVATLRVSTLSGLDNPGAYLRRSIVHRVASHRRSLGRRRARQPILDIEIRTVTTDSYPIELGGLLPDDPVDRAILWLTAIEGLPSQDVADAVDLSPAAVRKRLSRIRKASSATHSTKEDK